MPNIQDAFPSKYLKASDLNGREPIVTIKGVKYEAVGRDKEMKAVVYFKGKDKGIVLNKTNATKITKIVGSSETDDWRGHQIKLYSTETEFGGETVECIRIKPATAPPPPPEPDDDRDSDDDEPLTDDDIPF